MKPALYGLLRSRFGVALVLVVLVLAVVLVAKLAGDDEAPLLLPNRPPATTIDPTVGDDGVHGETPAPTVSPGTAAPLTVAEAFAYAWIDGTAPATVWHDRLLPYASSALAELLVDVDPATVPASEITGAASTTPFSDSLVEIAYPVDTGVLRLRVVALEGRWLVDWVDWERR